jgi:hypothetical protein
VVLVEGEEGEEGDMMWKRSGERFLRMMRSAIVMTKMRGNSLGKYSGKDRSLRAAIPYLR